MALRLGEQGGSFGSGLILGSQDAFNSTADVVGSGVLQAQAATMAGVALRGVVDLGTPPEFDAQLSMVTGVGEVIKTGSGILVSQEATVAGVGSLNQTIVGSGAMQAQSATIVAQAGAGIGGSGVLVSQAATVAGLGDLPGAVTGAGVLSAGLSAVVGLGSREVPGSGVLSATEAFIFGSGGVIAIAVDYDCYLPPTTFALEILPPKVSYELEFARNRNIPRSVSVDFDSLVTYQAGVKPPTEVAYEFSSGRKFVEDQD